MANSRKKQDGFDVSLVLSHHPKGGVFCLGDSYLIKPAAQPLGSHISRARYIANSDCRVALLANACFLVGALTEWQIVLTDKKAAWYNTFV